MTAGPLLEVRDLHMTFGGIRAVQGISFQVGEGETLGLIGPNGAGKTTVFNVIMAELKPTSGEIWFEGQNITRVPTHKRVKRGIARTYQVPQPFGEMSVGANIRVGMAPDDIWKLIAEGADPVAEAEIGRSVGFSDEQIDALPSELAMGDLRRLGDGAERRRLSQVAAPRRGLRRPHAQGDRSDLRTAGREEA